MGVAGSGATWAWSRVFWQQLEPAVRRGLGKRWGIQIEWERSTSRSGWEIRGPERGKGGHVALASVMVWMLGFFAPIGLVVAGVELGWIPSTPGFLLVLLSLGVSLWAWQLENARPGRPPAKRMAWIEPPPDDQVPAQPVSAEQVSEAKPPAERSQTSALPRRGSTRPGEGVTGYLIATSCIAGSTMLSLSLEPLAQLEDLAMIYLLGIVLLSMLCSVRLSLTAASVMVVIFDYFFVPPAFSFAEAELKHGLTFVVMVLVAAVVSGLQQRLRKEERTARDAAFRARTLYELEKELSASTGPNERMANAVRTLEKSFQAELQLVFGRPREHSEQLRPAQLALAESAWRERTLKVDSTDPPAWVFAPLLGGSGCLGVLGLSSPAFLANDGVWRDLLQTCASRLAGSLESAKLGEAARRSELEAETERTRSSLLSAVSHDLKTPLAAILAAGTTLLERRQDLDEQAFDELLGAVVLETERLSRLVHDLLSITRLESRTIVLRRSAESIEEIITVAVQRFEAQGVERSIKVDLNKELPLVMVDPTLIEQVFINLMANAVRYAGPASPIEISAMLEGAQLVARVADHGPGVPPAERERVFEKFYRSPTAASADGGIGLGLTICRSIVSAHGGTIAIRERPGGGTLVEFTLPALSSETGLAESGAKAP